MTKAAKRRVVVGVLLIVALGVFVPPLISVSRFRKSVAEKIAQAVGRDVTIGRVTLRLFPEPGFNLERVAIADDPALGAEPVVRADEVTATLRWSSLWRGRLEIGKLSLKYPSMNLVRGADGRWNIESLLEQARRIPAAPTSKTRPESRPRFPYIEATGGRINFKTGLEKKVYALTEADFALWLASENEWNVRLAARPVRTDSNLSDTGTVKLSGSFQRAWNLRETPLRLRLELQRAQLGQLSVLLYGRDRGWRGAVNASAVLTGTPAGLNLTADASVDDFRRYDILSGETLRLQAHCTGAYSTATGFLSGINCQLPIGQGTVTVRGSVGSLAQPRTYDLVLAAQDVGANALVVLARHLKKDLPPDLAADGAVDGAFTARRNTAGKQVAAGGGAATDVVLRSSTLRAPLRLGQINFLLQGPGTESDDGARGSRGQPQTEPTQQTRIILRPFDVSLGGAEPAHAHAWFSSGGYALQVRGDAQVARLVQVARGLGLRAPPPPASGTASIDLQVAGTWIGFAAPKATGRAQLRSVSVPLHGISAPLQITSAELVLSDRDLTLQKLAAAFSGTRLAFSGWIRMPRGCDAVEQCPAQFDLQAGQIATDELNRLLNPRVHRRPWYDLLRVDQQESFFSQVQAAGQISATRVLLNSVTAKRVSAQLKLEAGRVTASAIRAEVFGGVYRGEWHGDFTGLVPAYTSRGQLDGISMAQVATAMQDEWASGVADISYEGTASGWDGDALANSAAGSLQFDWRDGALAHLALSGQPPLRIRHFAGHMELRNGVLEIGASRMDTPAGIYKVSGTASLERKLGLKLLGDGSQEYVITGPLQKPQVALARAPATEASLKP